MLSLRRITAFDVIVQDFLSSNFLEDGGFRPRIRASSKGHMFLVYEYLPTLDLSPYGFDFALDLVQVDLELVEEGLLIVEVGGVATSHDRGRVSEEMDVATKAMLKDMKGC